MPVISSQTWETFLAQYPAAHLLQTEPWGRFKQAFGWEPVYITAGETGAQVLFLDPLGGTKAPDDYVGLIRYNVETMATAMK